MLDLYDHSASRPEVGIVGAEDVDAPPAEHSVAWSLLFSEPVAEPQLRKQLIDMHDRMERIIGELKVLRAKVAETTEDIERGAAFNRLRADGVWEL